MIKKLGIKNIISIIMAIIILIIGIPILINESYKYGRGYTTMWRAEDVLSYYGSIIGSAVTIIALIITIWFTNKNNRESFEQQKKLIIVEYKVEQLKKNFEVECEEISEFRDIILLKMFEYNSFYDLIFKNSFNELINKLIPYYMLCSKRMENNLSTKKDEEFWGKSQEILLGMLEVIFKFYNEIQSEEEIKNVEETKTKQEIKVKRNSSIMDQIKHAAGDKSNYKNTDEKVVQKDIDKDKYKYNKLKSELFKKRNDIQEDYINMYKEYIKYKENQLESKIKKLYV